jgi:anti-anti-sigma factor
VESRPEDSVVDQLQVDILREGPDALLSLSGELDIAVQGLLRRAIQRICSDPTERLLLDLAPLSFMDASSLTLILALQREFGDRFAVRPGRQRRLFSIIGLDRLMELDPDEGEVERFEEAAQNLGYVRRLYSAWEAGGVQAMAQLADDAVEWQPSELHDGTLNGTEELTDYWRRHASPSGTSPVWFTALGQNVLIEGEFPLEDGTRTTIYAFYEFSDRRLVRARAARGGRDWHLPPV